MLFSASTFIVRPACSTVTSPSSSPRYTLLSMTMGEPQMAANMSCFQSCLPLFASMACRKPLKSE
jgi:hypothetical protein